MESRIEGKNCLSETVSLLSFNDDEDTNDRVIINSLDVNQILDDIEDDKHHFHDGINDFEFIRCHDTVITSDSDMPSSNSKLELNGHGNCPTPKYTVETCKAILMLKEFQHPMTEQKANCEDINDNFCKFELKNPCITTLREEQMSEARTLSADALKPIIVDPLLDENTSLLNLAECSMDQNGPNNDTSINRISGVNSHNSKSGSQSNSRRARSNRYKVSSYKLYYHVSDLNYLLFHRLKLSNRFF